MRTVPDQSDEAVVRQTLEGNVEAYGLLVEKYRARFLGLAFHLCGDYETAADLVQDALITAYDCLDRLRDPSAFAAWAAGILRNKYRNLGRTNPVSTVSLDSMIEAGFDPPGKEEKPDFTAEELQAVATCLASLPDKYREVVAMRYCDDLSYKEIAELLGIPATTVTTRLNRGRDMLWKAASKSAILGDMVPPDRPTKRARTAGKTRTNTDAHGHTRTT